MTFVILVLKRGGEILPMIVMNATFWLTAISIVWKQSMLIDICLMMTNCLMYLQESVVTLFVEVDGAFSKISPLENMRIPVPFRT